jgi:hypothetical protein
MESHTREPQREEVEEYKPEQWWKKIMSESERCEKEG